MRKTQHTIGLLSLAVLSAGSLSLTAQRAENQTAGGRMSGTYDLDRTRGGNPERAADAATRSLPPGQRERAYQSLLHRLEPPQTLSIDRAGRTINIASSRGPRSSFYASGRSEAEHGQNGRMVTTLAEIDGDQLRVSTSGGSRGSDFSVIFESLKGGSGLRVTRRLDADDLAQPVTIQTYYRRTSTTPRWDVYTPERGNDPAYGGRSWFRSAGVVPHGTQLLATLDTPVNMRTSRNDQPFTMTIRSPAEFQGARIDGVISRVNADQNTGTARDVRVDFRTIEISGRSSDFDALLNTVRLPDGTLLRIEDDGEVRDANRGNASMRYGAIGAAVGAIIGAVTAGDKGAAIGAVIGGASGVILARGHEQLDLPRGTDVTLTAVSRYR